MSPSCRACAAADIPCTFARSQCLQRQIPQPVNKKNDEYTNPWDALVAGTPTKTWTQHKDDCRIEPGPDAPGQHCRAESIFPAPVLNNLLEDFFTYVYPLAPFPHETDFRESWQRRRDLTDQGGHRTNT